MHAIEFRERQESVNGRLKVFSILRQTFRHRLSNHWLYFHAVSQIVALTLENGYPLFAL